MDQCVHPLPLSGSCDQHRDKRRLGHCSTHQVRGVSSEATSSWVSHHGYVSYHALHTNSDK